MDCEECGEEECIVDCKACGKRESWCQNCQDAEYFDPEGELCSDCFDKSEEKAAAAREEYAQTVAIKVEVLDLSIDELGNLAVQNAIFQKMDYLQRAEMRGELTTQPTDYEFRGSDGRDVANFLRHCATNYDQILKGLPKLRRRSRVVEVEDSAYQVIRDRVQTAIQNAYPSIDISFD